MRHTISRRRAILTGLAASFSAAMLPTAGFAQTASPQAGWPTRPVRLIVPYAAGGSTDVVARPWAEKLTQAFGQSFVIDNRGGASGSIGAEAAARATPDGYTFLLTPNSALSIVPQLRKVGYDVKKDFTPVARVGDLVGGFVVRADLGINTLAELVAYAKKNPGKLAYGGGGLGTTTQMRIETLKIRAGIDILYVPYRGNGEAMTDLLGGQIQLMNEIITFPHVKAGTLKLLAMSHTSRHPEFPDVPTLTEAGFPDADVPLWFGLHAPAGTARDIITRLNAKIVEIARTEEMIKRMREISVVVPTQTPEEMVLFLEADFVANGKVIREANIKME